MKFRNNKEIYEKYLFDLKQKLIKKYDELGLRASGDYEKGLDYEIEKNVLRMTAPYHSWFMEHGRKPSKKFPPRKAIEDWIEVKAGLPDIFREKKKQFAFLIARKIAKKGISVPNKYNKGKVISEVINEFLSDTIYQMLEELGGAYVKQIKSDVVKTLKEI